MENKQPTAEKIYHDYVGWYPEDGAIEAMTEYAQQQTAALQEALNEKNAELSARRYACDTLSDENTILQARVVELERERERLIYWCDKVEPLEARIAELERENGNLKFINQQHADQITTMGQHAEKLMEEKDDMYTSLLEANHDNDLQKIEIEGLKYDNETLMGLLEKIIKRSPMPELDWQSYCTEHNLKPTDNGTR